MKKLSKILRNAVKFSQPLMRKIDMKYTLKSKVRDVWKNPVGHDILAKILLQLKLPTILITNPIISHLSLKRVKALAKGRLSEGFFETLIDLLSSVKDPPNNGSAEEIEEAWWKEALFYQIYPRSFMDSDSDGVGDLNGILMQLDYLKSLGVDALWLSPIYDSPNDDNGYDIRDYEQILDEFGTMEDFEALLDGIHQRGMKLIMDLVVNHTSDEHTWFQKALNEPSSPYRNYYFLQPATESTPPNNWTSFFSGSAWNHYEEQKLWGLHLFSKKQMDLNWENPALREDIYEMIRHWLDRGVDGFRLDVINYISKRPGLPYGDETIGQMMGYCGIEHYFYGPRLHEFLREIREKAFAPYEAFSVGETPGVGMEMSKQLTASSRGELDMVFSFDHLETPGHTRFDDYVYDLNYLKKYLIDWTLNYGNDCWQTLFYENHDNPRMVSKVDPSKQYRAQVAKLLGMLSLTLKGTPFIFQGQELGAVNKEFKDITQIKDVESIRLYRELISDGMSEEAAFSKILSGTRDHARTPMQWRHAKNGGFSVGEPWIMGDGDEASCNAEEQMENPDSVLRFYQSLIALRKENKTLIYGNTRFIKPKRKNYFAYTRELHGVQYGIECNLSAHSLKRSMGWNHLLLSNYDGNGEILKPYEGRLYRL